MKIIEFKKYENNPEHKKINKKRVGIAIGILSILLVLIIIFAIYVCNSNFRNFMDQYVLQKNVIEDSIPYIDIENNKNMNIFAFDKRIVILEKNRLKEYSESGNKISELEVNVSTPLAHTSGKYLIIAEKEKQRAYLVTTDKIVWEKELEGNISRVSVNKNGYVSIILSGTTYKSVIITYDNTGREIFKTYLSNTIATDTTISDDNKFMSFAEIDTSGTLIQYKIKTISIEIAKQTPDQSMVYVYQMDTDQLLVDLEYQNKNRLVAMCNNGVWILEHGGKEQIVEYKSDISKITFSGIQLNDSAFKIEEIIYGPLNQASNVIITDSATKKSNVYTINGVAKEVYSNDNVIAVNTGTEVYFIRTNGWLVKKYISTQEVKSIVISEKIAGIIYRDKIGFLGL